MATSFQAVAAGAMLLFPLSEIALGIWKRAWRVTATVEDRGSLRMLWVVIVVALGLGFLCKEIGRATIATPPGTLEVIAVALVLAGLTLRWISIVTLGRFFTVDVAVQAEHRVVDSGPYRYVRHPSYTGLLMAFLGLAIFMGNWISLAVVMAPVTVALMRRIRIEEAALTHALGDAYTAYCARTKRLIPGVL